MQNLWNLQLIPYSFSTLQNCPLFYKLHLQPQMISRYKIVQPKYIYWVVINLKLWFH